MAPSSAKGASPNGRRAPLRSLSFCRTVVLVCYNHTEFAMECLASLEDHLPPGVATIVVDNGSTNDLRPAFRKQFPWVHLVRVELNRGYASGANAGARFALDRGAELLYFLNDDTVLLPGFWEECERSVVENQAGIAASIPLLYDDPRRMQNAGVFYDLHRLEGRRRGGEALYSSEYRGFFPCDAVVGAGMMVTAEVFQRLGGFDERFYLYFEETDLCLRARRHGFIVGVAGDSCLLHRYNATVGRHSPCYHYYMYRNLIWFARLHMSGADYAAHIVRAVMQKVSTDFSKHIEVRRRKRIWLAIVRGLWDGFIRRPQAFRSLPYARPARDAAEPEPRRLRLALAKAWSRSSG